MPDNEFLEAFEELLDAQEEVLDERLTVTVGDVENKDAIVEKLTFDDIVAAGGVAEKGGFRLQVRESDFPGDLHLRDATARGVTLKVMTEERNNGVLVLTIGDPVAEDEE
jgi:hypothetical protein